MDGEEKQNGGGGEEEEKAGAGKTRSLSLPDAFGAGTNPFLSEAFASQRSVPVDRTGFPGRFRPFSVWDARFGATDRPRAALLPGGDASYNNFFAASV
jgi:hypothetical protein